MVSRPWCEAPSLPALLYPDVERSQRAVLYTIFRGGSTCVIRGKVASPMKRSWGDGAGRQRVGYELLCAAGDGRG